MEYLTDTTWHYEIAGRPVELRLERNLWRALTREGGHVCLFHYGETFEDVLQAVEQDLMEKRYPARKSTAPLEALGVAA